MAADGVAPNERVWGCVVEAAAVAGKPSVAAEALHRMRAAGVRPNVVAYTSLLSAYGATGNVDAARAVVAEMRAAGVPPNSKTYTELMSQLAARGALCAALRCALCRAPCRACRPHKRAQQCAALRITSGRRAAGHVRPPRATASPAPPAPRDLCTAPAGLYQECEQHFLQMVEGEDGAAGRRLGAGAPRPAATRAVGPSLTQTLRPARPALALARLAPRPARPRRRLRCGPRELRHPHRLAAGAVDGGPRGPRAAAGGGGAAVGAGRGAGRPAGAAHALARGAGQADGGPSRLLRLDRPAGGAVHPGRAAGPLRGGGRPGGPGPPRRHHRARQPQARAGWAERRRPASRWMDRSCAPAGVCAPA